ncbi:MAG: hypothetical protein JWN08_1013 [Frankiales bacterium]|nr:hypothetical protein [Frankiales bacterium]
MVLDALGHDRQLETVDESDETADELARAGVGRQALHEGAVEPEPAQGQLAQVGEVGVAGAEVVQRRVEALGAQTLEQLGTVVGQDLGLGELEADGGRRQVGAVEVVQDLGDQAGNDQHVGADVHRHLDVVPGGGPGAQVVTDVREHDVGEGPHQAGLLHERQESVGSSRLRVGCCQRTRASTN